MSVLRFCCALLLVSVAEGRACADEPQPFVQLVIPLKRDGSYSLRAFCQACNETLHSGYPLGQIEDRDIPLTQQNKQLLEVARVVGIDIRLEPSRLVLRLPNPDCAALRGEQRRNLERMLAVPPGTWPIDLGLTVPKHFNGSAPGVVFVHGLQSSSECFRTYTDACRKRGLQVLTFDYPNRGDLKEAGERLSKDLRDLQVRHPGLRLVMVGHSMGGLVSRWALEGKDTRPSCVDDIFLLGVPHQGSKLARHEALLHFVETLRTSGSLRTGFGEAGCDLELGSKFLTQLATARRNPAVRYHLFAGSRGFVKSEELPELRQKYVGLLERLKLQQQERARSLTYFESLDEIVTGKGDGVVSVASATGLADTATRRVLPVDHWQLLTDSDGEILLSIFAAADRLAR